MIIKENLDLTEYNSYRVKAICAKAYFPETDEDIIEIFKNTDKKVILGGGYNTILSKPYYQEPFVIFNKHFGSVEITGNIVSAQAGISLLELSELALENSLSGLETFYDIPSSLGGAVVMNAGAGGEEIKDLLTTVKYFDPASLTFYEKPRDEINFEYRNSFFQKNPHFIIIKAELILRSGVKADILNKMQSIKAARWAKQPKEYPNGGSVFKRPSGKFVGPMIEELGLKGYSVGGAKVSEKHAGFIVNFDNATGADILNLISEIQLKVKTTYDIDLEVEQRII
ncbi:UDP-N-acetylmuramate dehydrogenase [uncultured Pontibacter sp.]|uniref:UDP-N-acetylmuramate dehydrogenase n=1 Tax=uncultured Pontibacter sp. TaxID=453356 RepID=UPI0026387F16|nr:UDP-N-acetylmuramate dehydrogenase [uncultured Pontibacter sp.]